MRGVVVAVVVLLLAAAPASAAPLDLERLTVAELQAKLSAGELTSVELTKAYLDRIAALNRRGPGLNAVRLVNPDALTDAALLDLERRKTGARGPLHGIPVLVKDNLDVAGLPTTAGAIALEHSIATDDSTVVSRLRSAGAVILGKTNLSEFANFITNSNPSGYSGLGGQVLNALDADQNPSGSSSGSATAAAAALAAVTIGTETSGSIVSPSAAQGIVGLRPTVGLVSRYGIVPIAASQDTAGPMTRTVADAAAELAAIAGADPLDPPGALPPGTILPPPPVLPDYLAGLDAGALAGKRIGIINDNNSQYQAAIAAIQALGAVTQVIPAPQANAGPQILNYEFKRDLNAYLAHLGPGAPMKSLADVIAFNEAHPQEAIKFGHTILTASQALDISPGSADTAAYLTALTNGKNATRAALDAAYTRGTADPSDDFEAIMTPSGTLTGIGARAGYPQLTVPAGYGAQNRRAVNIAFNGPAFSEARLLAFGFAYEQATKLRRPASEIVPSLYRCAVPTAYSGRGACAPGIELLGSEPSLPFALETESAQSLAQRIAAGTLTSVDLTRAYLARISRTNTEGPSINAVRIVNPHALAEAAARDAEAPRGPLHGLPVIVKDNIDVAGLPTTAGSVALQHSIPDEDAPLVARLRQAGAVILGKANLTEFANFMTNGMPSGYSSLGGQVLNPYDADLSPSGSSSGSGAAAAAGLAALTVGTETSGSIVSPAAAQGVVGLRPTLALVSQEGILPIAASQDTAGPLTRTVYDAALELGGLAGGDFTGGLSPTALAGGRIGVVTSNDPNYTAAVAAIQSAGATTVTIPVPTATNVPQVLTYEFKRDLNAYLAGLPESAPMDSLADIVAYNAAHPEEALKFGQAQLVASQAVDLSPGSADTVAYEANLAAGKAANRAAIDNALTRGTADPADDLEAIMTPSGNLIGIGARAGYPQLTVPAGYDLDATQTFDPVNVSFTGTAGSDAKLLAFGYAYEQATKLRLPATRTNPSLWRCVPGSAFTAHSCAPGEPPDQTPVATDVSGTVPATLSLALSSPVIDLGVFQPGVARDYTATVGATVTSTAGSATLSARGERLANGPFSLARPLEASAGGAFAPIGGTLLGYPGPVSNGTATISLRQSIGASEGLRTGRYGTTVTFTLSTDSP
jgi:Asp-tRNA(Asn)/Glu-tRNA(Gln) amidotransferase A subunit family amidase